MSKNIIIPTDLFVAINHLCAGVESKILFSIVGYGEDNMFQLTNNQIIKLSGITRKNNYFVSRKKLMDRGYLTIDDNGLHVNVDTILNDYKEEFIC